MAVQPTTVTVGLTYKKSLPNYENITFHAGMTVPVSEGTSYKKAYKEAWDAAGDEISAQLSLFEDENKSGVKKGL
ncbi:hypothetical protein [Peribacillus frigoritolerans]|uniref:Uncharacterized protein n=1 Tax=Peribacillus castrilensis TaxID=2897690 RepID=A0AAW9NLA2_9BACI|nr:hypothetical protein [Peribacillus castrilensis]